MKVRILGCGTSSGVPRIANDWGLCDPSEPRNRRRRVSILVEQAETRILVDTAPDLREQLLDAGVDRLSAVIWTHDHADHCHGIDDLRPLVQAAGGPVPGYGRDETLAALRERFGYVFAGGQSYPPIVAAHRLEDELVVGSIRIRVVDQPHGPGSSAGLRFEASGRSVVYSTDFSALTADMMLLFEATDLWVVDALRRRPHPTHPHLDQVLGWIGQVRPRRTILTHMDNSMDYATLRSELPPGVEPGYDGMEISL
jgi:phosphoribosyl 1,2-cyclic phosphate phosphodiesterase